MPNLPSDTLENLLGGCPLFESEIQLKAYERGCRDGMHHNITNPYSPFTENTQWRFWIIGFKTCYTFPNQRNQLLPKGN